MRLVNNGSPLTRYMLLIVINIALNLDHCTTQSVKWHSADWLLCAMCTRPPTISAGTVSVLTLVLCPISIASCIELFNHLVKLLLGGLSS